MTPVWRTSQAQKLIKEIEEAEENIYFEEPEYSFTITPQNIINIKAYNRSREKEYNGFNDFELTCTCNNDGSYEICPCESNFLKNIEMGGSLRNLVTEYKRNGVEY